jgi:hypothetical protein
VVKVLTRKGLQNLPLRDGLKATGTMTTLVTAAVKGSVELEALGVEILGLSFLAIKPTPERPTC